MTKLILTSIFISGWLFAFPQSGKVKLVVQNVQVSKGGEISAGIFQEKNFPKIGKQFRGMEKAVSGSKMTFLFDEVPEGEYALAVFQDVDKDKDLKTNFVGLPKEPIGFSNDARIRLGPPPFDSAKVKVKGGETLELTVVLR